MFLINKSKAGLLRFRPCLSWQSRTETRLSFCAMLVGPPVMRSDSSSAVIRHPKYAKSSSLHQNPAAGDISDDFSTRDGSLNHENDQACIVRTVHRAGRDRWSGAP